MICIKAKGLPDNYQGNHLADPCFCIYAANDVVCWKHNNRLAENFFASKLIDHHLLSLPEPQPHIAMFPKRLHELNINDIHALIGVAKENTVTEFKQVLKIATEAERKEFLADVSSFANKYGGRLLFGIAESKGIAAGLAPLDIPDEDNLALQLQSIIRDGIAPSINFELAIINVSDGKGVIVIQIGPGSEKPYCIIYKRWEKYFSRNGNGKYPMSPGEVKSMVLEVEKGSALVKQFLDERLVIVSDGKFPIPLGLGGKVALWMIPRANLLSDHHLALNTTEIQTIPLLGNGSRSPTFNTDGLLMRNLRPHGDADRYVQFFNNGAIEAVNAEYMFAYQGQKRLPVDRSLNYEKDIVKTIESYLELYEKINIDYPVQLRVALLGCKEAWLAGGSFHYFNGKIRPLSVNQILSGLLTLTDSNQDIPALLKPFFDTVWRGCGFPHSFNYTEDGKWNPR